MWVAKATPMGFMKAKCANPTPAGKRHKKRLVACAAAPIAGGRTSCAYSRHAVRDRVDRDVLAFRRGTVGPSEGCNRWAVDGRRLPLIRAGSLSGMIVVSPLFASFVLVMVALDVALDIDVAVTAFTPKAPCAERWAEQHDEDQWQAPTETFFHWTSNRERLSNHHASIEQWAR